MQAFRIKQATLRKVTNLNGPSYNTWLVCYNLSIIYTHFTNGGVSYLSALFLNVSHMFLRLSEM